MRYKRNTFIIKRTRFSWKINDILNNDKSANRTRRIQPYPISKRALFFFHYHYTCPNKHDTCAIFMRANWNRVFPPLIYYIIMFTDALIRRGKWSES